MKKDLLILVADKDTESCLKGLLPRFPDIFTLKAFTYDIIMHPLKDAGCYTLSHEFLRPFTKSYDYCIVVFDYEGCGQDKNMSIENVENNVKELLTKNGWENRCEVIVIEPELENWIWVQSKHLAEEIRWQSIEELHQWLVENNLKEQDAAKPKRPKEAFQAALRKSGKRLSPAIYEDIAKKASFKKCIDKSFIAFCDYIKQCFSINHV